MRTLYDLKPGDRVQVFISYKRNQPRGGDDGEVVKVGRKLITVKYGWGTTVFRMENGRANDRFGHTYIRTPEQVEEMNRRTDLLSRLKALGLEPVSYPRTEISTDKIEAIVKIMEEPE